MVKFFESQVDDLRGLSVLPVDLVAICAICVHALGVPDVFLDSGLAELVLHHGDECMTEGVQSARKISLGFQPAPLVSHRALVPDRAVRRAEHPFCSEVKLLISLDDLIQDGASCRSDRYRAPGVLILTVGDVVPGIDGASDPDTVLLNIPDLNAEHFGRSEAGDSHEAKSSPIPEFGMSE